MTSDLRLIIDCRTPRLPSSCQTLPRIRRSAQAVDTGLDFVLGPRTTAGVSYSGQIAHNVHDNAVKGRLTWLF
jgi:uncharacterized protein with beta-barrel porin domain